MQDGSVTVERRKRGPDVWCFRWREAGPDGRRIHRRIVLGTADELRSIASARKVVVGLRRERQLDDGIGDTLVAVRATCGVYKWARLRCRNYIHLRWTGADCGSVCRGARFRRSWNTHVRPSSLLAPSRNK